MPVVKSIEIDIGVKGDAASKAKIDAIDAKAEHLKKIFGDGFTAKINTAAASEKLKVFRAEMADAAKDRTATVKVKVDDSALQKFANNMKSGGGPAWLGPALALAPAAGTLTGVAGGAAVGLAGAAVAGGAALAAFGAVAKPVLADALKAEQAVQTAQDAYTLAIQKTTGQYQIAMATAKTQAQRNTAYAAEQKGFAAARLAETQAISKAYIEMSPQQIALSKQLGNMATAWQNLKAAETPVVAGALQPWLKSVTDLTGKLSPIINAVAPVIGDLGTRIDTLVKSPEFAKFLNFVTGTGQATIGAAGGTAIDFIDALVTLLPKFTPLINGAVNGIAHLGPAVQAWANSKKTSDDITKFMDWFKANGPAVGQFLKNTGGALKALAPGLTAGGVTELKLLSDFFGWVAKLPPGIAKPLAETAGALLILNKLGVFSVGVKLVGLGSTGGGAGAAAAGAGAAGAAGGLWSRILPGVRLAGGALLATVAIETVLKNTPSGKPGSGANWLDNPLGGSNPSNPVKGSKPNALSSWNQLGADIANIWNSTWNNTITRTAKGFHDIAGWFDTGRHWTADRTNLAGHDIVNWWNITWNNTITRTARGFHDIAGWFNTGRHDTAAITLATGHDIAHYWDVTWSSTTGRAQRGAHDTAAWFDSLRHGTAAVLDGTRRDAAAAWNLIWVNTTGRAQRGVSDVTGWVRKLPGQVEGAFKGAGTWLLGAGKDVIQGFWNGLTFTWGKVTAWISGLAGWIAKHKGPVSLDRTLLYPAGRALMEGLKVGLQHGFVDIKGIVTGAASDIGAWVMGGGNKLLGFGLSALHGLSGAAKSLWDKLFGGGTAGGGTAQWAGLVTQALKMEHLPAGYLGDVLYQMQTESGGNPNAQNNTDINAQLGDPSRGLMQVIGATFAMWHWPGTSFNIFDPLANIAAALNYAAHGKGFGSGMGQIGSGHGYALGTMSAAPGWARVGERGPEWLRFRGGEQVLPAGTMPRGGGGTQTIIIRVDPVIAASTPDKNLGRQIGQHLSAFRTSGGRLYPAGTVPR
jgi:hypothetical protein